MNRLRRLRLGAWCTALVSALWFLQFAGRGELASPPLGHWTQLTAWPAQVGLANAVVATLRLAGLAAVWYLLAVTFVGALARATGWAACVAHTDRVMPVRVRRLLQGAGLWTAAGLTLTTTPLVVLATTSPRVDVLAVTLSTDSNSPTPSPAASEEALPENISTEHVGTEHLGTEHLGTEHLGTDDLTGQDAAKEADAEPPRISRDERSTDPKETVPSTDRPDLTTWTVAPGDHFWSIAEAVLADAGLAGATDDTGRYWMRLVDANRSVLIAPDNPDLLYPGQVLSLPRP